MSELQKTIWLARTGRFRRTGFPARRDGLGSPSYIDHFAQRTGMLVNVPAADAGNDGMVPGAALLGTGVPLGIDGDFM